MIRVYLAQNMQIIVLNQVLEILKTKDESNYRSPYNDVECRLELLKTLATIIKEPHPKWSIPISHALNIFHIGLRTPCVKVSRYIQYFWELILLEYILL